MKESITELKNKILSVLSNSTELESAIDESIAMVGKYFGVDRVYIFENSEDDLRCSNTFEWCNEGISPEKDSLQDLRYLEDLGGTWIDNYNADGLFFCPTVSELPKKQRDILEPQGIFSMLQCAIKERGVFKGYIGFDNCQDHLGGWEFDQDAIDALVFSSRLMSLFLLEYRNKSKQLEYMNQLEEQNGKLERFIRYVTRANEQVMEVNLETSHAKLYVLDAASNTIQTIPVPYAPVNANEFRALIHPDDYQSVMHYCSVEALTQMIESGGEQYFESREKQKDGTYNWYSFNLQAIPRSRENPKNFILFKKNIEEAKQDEEKRRQLLKDALSSAKAASAAKGNFLSNMSHEIRTPLNAIIGYLSIAKEADASASKIMHCIDNCTIASKHLLQIINDVLDMSAIESGKLKIAHEEFDLKKEIADITTIYYQNSKNKGVNFETHVEELSQEWVIGDQLRLNQVLMNLLSNAVKFTPDGGSILFQIREVQTNDYDVFVTFTVKDTGIGMSPDYMKRLFSPFEQETAGTAKKFGGSGLGLSITKNLINMMNGSIEVESEQGKGSTFTVTMTFDRAVNHKEVEPGAVDYTHVHVLVVDDQEEEASYVRRMLQRCGVKADAVHSGAQALQRLQSRIGSGYDYDLCILDWNMPDMNGIEVARAIREMFGSKLPVIIATAYDVSELEDAAKEAGVNRVVAKPLFQSTLFDLLVNHFGKYVPKPVSKNVDVDLKGLHVLLAEDNEMNMEIAVSILEKAGIVVDQAINGSVAVERFIQSPADTYDLILMDIQMPVMDGFEATHEIRTSSHPQAHTIPIIAMTANAFAEDVAEALSKGMDAHIAKPIDRDKLFTILQKFSAFRKNGNTEN